MYEFLRDPEFLECVKSQTPYHFKNLGLKLFEWDDVFSEMNDKAKRDFVFGTRPGFFIMFEDADRLPGVKAFLDHMIEVIQSKWTAHCYISLTEKAEGYGMHRDNADVLYWQVIGRTRWEVDGRVFVLDPNDAVWIPRYKWHAATPLCPRAGISFGMDHVNEPEDFVYQGR